MKTITATELVRRPARYIRESGRGGTIVITERGVPTARIEPVPQARPASEPTRPGPRQE